MINKKMRGGTKIILGIFLAFALFLIPVVSAQSGVGLAWNKESALVAQNTKTCLTYNVYNPYPNSTYAKIVLSQDMQNILTSSSSQARLIPGNTPSSAGVPVKLCFKTPKVYPKDCWIGNSLICKQTCNGTMKTYSGDVEAVQVSAAEFKSGGSGGSRTQMSVSAPIRVRVQCVPHGRNFTLIYVLILVIASILLALNIRKHRSSKGVNKKESKKTAGKDESLEEKNKELEEKIKKLEEKEKNKSSSKKKVPKKK